jgi:transposase
VEQNGLPVSIVISSANQHDSTKFIDVVESISEYLGDDAIEQIVSVYADKGNDSKTIRNYLKNRNMLDCIPKRDSKTKCNGIAIQNKYNKTRFVVERFFAWLKNGFHRTAIRYEKNSENYLGFVCLASIMMYWRVLG